MGKTSSTESWSRVMPSSVVFNMLWVLLSISIDAVSSSPIIDTLSQLRPSIRGLTSKRADPGFRTFLGIPSSNYFLAPNGIGFGVLPDFTDPTNNIETINSRIGSNMSSALIGDYLQISSQSPNLGQIQDHMNDLMSMPMDQAGLRAVYVPAIMPTLGLDDFVNNNLAEVVAASMKELNDQGFVVWLRFAYEMNGSWMVWGRQPQAYIAAFRAMASAIKAVGATKTLMLWSPNILSGSGDINSLDGYTPYYPGDDVTDMVGLSFYSFGEDQTMNTVAPDGMFVNGLAPFYNLYGHKAVVLSETGAAYHLLSSSDSDPAPGGADERSIKTTWVDQITSMSTANQFPNFVAVIWFNYFKEEKGNQFLDYRIFNSADGGTNIAVTQLILK